MKFIVFVTFFTILVIAISGAPTKNKVGDKSEGFLLILFSFKFRNLEDADQKKTEGGATSKFGGKMAQVLTTALLFSPMSGAMAGRPIKPEFAPTGNLTKVTLINLIISVNMFMNIDFRKKILIPYLNQKFCKANTL